MEHGYFKVTDETARRAHLKDDKYLEMYDDSIRNPEDFWGKQSQRLEWFKPWKTVKKTSFEKPISIQWYLEGQLNACFNCVDRHLPERADQVAFYWEPDVETGAPAKVPKELHGRHQEQQITYQQLHDHVARWAKALKEQGVKKGDRVTLYLPMIPEAVYSMLACARIGAVHSVVFAGFSPEALADRIRDCESEYLITADEGLRGTKIVPLKQNADAAADKCPDLKKVFVVKHTGENVAWNSERDVWHHEAIKNCDTDCPCEEMDSEDPLFILYTSGSTNKPKGVLHTTGGYLTYASFTHEMVFDYHQGDVYWCAADIGWVTGHSYIVYGPLSNGATSVMFEGVPTCPDASRIWQIVDKYKINTLYTAPTLIRALMQKGESYVKSTSRESLRLLGSVGEPINPEAWMWYYNVAGDSRCPIVDTWWQTETGGIMVTPLPGATDLKPGSATRPFFGVQLQIVDGEGKVLTSGSCPGCLETSKDKMDLVEGNLVIADSWPGQMRGVYKNPERFYETYFSQFPGKYFTGDGCRRDENGYYWITGRVDDVLNVSGHRMGTAEIESSLVEHPSVAEAAVVGFPHAVKGQGIYAYVTLIDTVDPNGSTELTSELEALVSKDIGKFAKPEHIHYTPALPKTRSGKIMRRILRKIAAEEFENLGDTSTLAEPAVVEQLIAQRQGH